MLPYPGGGAYGGYSAAPMHPTGFQHGYAAPPAYQQAGGWVHQEQYLDPAAELDRVVNSSKNMRDGTRTDKWLEQMAKLMQQIKLDPIPDSALVNDYALSSESGTELSQAGTTDFMQGDPSALTPPESPPWRRKNEGGILAEIPPIGSYPARAGGEGLHAAALAARAQAPAQGGSMPRGVSDSELSSQDSSSKGGAAGKVDPGKPGMSAAAAAATAAGRRGSALGQGGAGNAQQEQQQQAASTRGGSGVGGAAGGAPALPVPVPGKQVTLGMTFGRGDGQTGLDIVRLKDGGVAQLQSDLAVGDQVVSIDGTELAGLSPLEVNKLVVGPQGSEALLKVLKRDSPDSEVCTVSLLREVGAAAARPAAFGVVRKG